VQPSPLRARAFSAVLASAVVLAAAGVDAKGEVLVALDYQTDPSLAACPGASDFRKEIARQLGHDPFRDSAARRMSVRLYPVGAGMGGRVEWRNASDQWEGERTFSSRSASCPEIAHAVALATAIQIQLLATVEDGAPPAPPPAEPRHAAPVPPPAAVADTAPPLPPPPAREPLIAVDVGLGVIQDFGSGPAFVVPHIAVSLGRPAATGIRLAATGLGPGADVTRSEGSARVDRLVMTLGLVRFFRPGRTVQPTLAIGGGFQDVRVRGTSAMPQLAQAHDGHVFSAVVAASGGVAFLLATRLSVILQLETLIFQPSVAVRVGSSEAAHLDGAAVFAHGGVLARF
jgi:hypothetical protein